MASPRIFADKRVRQAMTMLTDRERICQEVMLGYATVASGPFAPEQAERSDDQALAVRPAARQGPLA